MFASMNVSIGLAPCYLSISLGWNDLGWEKGGGVGGSKPEFLTDGRGQCQHRPGREAGYKVGPSERQTTYS